MTPAGVEALTTFVADAVRTAEERGCEDMLGFATSAVRDAVNSDAVLAHVEERTGVELAVLSGEDEARLTFLAVRRWFGWSAGRLAVFDIGGGSLEIAGGADEAPDVAWSMPIGAARLARRYFAEGTPSEDDVRRIRHEIRVAIARDAGLLLRSGRPDRAVATSKTFRSIARICGAAPSAAGPLVPRALDGAELRRLLPSLLTKSVDELSALPGVSPSRAHQVVPGALVAEACLDIFDLPALEICPWALREGVILERLDQLSVLGA